MVTKQDIKDTAFTLFARKGYAETSTEDIAKALGLKKQSLYSHFKSKVAILCEIMQDQSYIMFAEIGTKIKELADQPAEILLSGIANVYISIFSNRNRLLLWKRIILLTGNDEYREMFSEILQFDKTLSKDLFKILKRNNSELSQHDFDYFFVSYMILIFGYLEWMLLNDHDDAIFNVVWRNYWRGAKRQLNLG